MSARTPAGGPAADGGPPPEGSLRAHYARIAASSEEELAADLLALTATHGDRDRDRLRDWAATALEFGREMADSRGDAWSPPDIEITEKERGGVRPGEILLAEYLHRGARSRVVVYDDALTFAGRVARAAGWSDDYSRATVREAALAHEEAHRMLHGELGRSLRRRLDHTALRIGPLRVRGHVVGADEITAHSYARHRCSLRRSPIALTAAIAAALTHRGPDRQGPGPRATTPGVHP
ncbi:hypothetical protein [Nocardiopsis sp. MG754419]|uniref:hypothetical protein n=1 Tax=Nocardiopsis sp. MG754419 TaxID=2259865 RepID=UPI001BA5D070|nr:hypothetical protein [Nocardiopsis sp. MG754419]